MIVFYLGVIMSADKIEYIEFDEFVNNCKVSKRTVEKRYKEIPGIYKTGNGFKVLSGTRYPCKIKNYKNLDDGYKKRYVLLKEISRYRYISHKDLRIEQRQFKDMLGELLSAGLIKRNNLCNEFGANAYDCTIKGNKLINKKEKECIKEIMMLISEAVGTFAGVVISEIISP